MWKLTNYKIHYPDGTSETVWYETYEDALKIVNDRLKTWENYILTGWISNTFKPFCAEHKVKFFLECLSYLLLQSDHKANRSNGVISKYKDSENRIKELLLRFQEDDELKVNYALVNKHNGKYKTKRSDEAKKIIKELKNSDVSYCRVDTDNVFVFHGVKYKIDQSVSQYGYVITSTGERYYAMDCIVVVVKDGNKYYYDSDYKPIDSKLICHV